MEVRKHRRRPSTRTVKEEELHEAMEGFRRKALELGASAAEVIPASQVVVEERVWMKCLVPRCAALVDGGTPYCPPYTPQPDFMRKVFSQYRWAILLKTDVTLEDHVPVSKAHRKEIALREKDKGSYHGKTCEIIGRLESYAQSGGYDLAMGFSAGSCKVNLCNRQPCGVMVNGSCRHPLKARPSMEGVGIDVFDLASKVGWDVYMIRNIEPDLSVIPCAVSIGIVFIY